jgi:hypothetical protein
VLLLWLCRLGFCLLDYFLNFALEAARFPTFLD